MPIYSVTAVHFGRITDDPTFYICYNYENGAEMQLTQMEYRVMDGANDVFTKLDLGDIYVSNDKYV